MEQAAHRRFAVLAKVPPGQLDAARQRPRNKRRLGAQLAQLVHAELALAVQLLHELWHGSHRPDALAKRPLAKVATQLPARSTVPPTARVCRNGREETDVHAVHLLAPVLSHAPQEPAHCRQTPAPCTYSPTGHTATHAGPIRAVPARHMLHASAPGPLQVAHDWSQAWHL
mmetsp:Transcript_42689/g.105169  ORF Transcript_42689/g.105169 Transcript_42689/m.105169 type:complete len:171 (-) Transcript_42689:449-961(-)